MSLEIRMLDAGDNALFEGVAPGVFDNSTDPLLVAQFLTDPRHHLAAAIDGGQVVGFASGVHYVHPDKPSEMWINEVGVAPSHQGRGLGKAIMQALLQHAERLGCREAWVLTDRSNHAAMRLYASAGGEEAFPDQVMFTFFLNREDRHSSTGSHAEGADAPDVSCDRVAAARGSSATLARLASRALRSDSGWAQVARGCEKQQAVLIDKRFTMQMNPYLSFRGDCEAAFKFYERSLGGTLGELFRYGGSPMAGDVPAAWSDKVMHGSLSLGGQVLMGGDVAPDRYEEPKGFSLSLQIKNTSDAERVFRELAADGRVVVPLEKTFWAERFGMLVDRFGIPWLINCEGGDSPAER